MKKKTCLIVDDKNKLNLNYKNYDLIIVINSFIKKQTNIILISDYIDENKIILRNMFLKFENEINHNFIKHNKNFYLDKKFNFYDLSLIKEKNPFKSAAIHKSILLLSIQKILKDNNINHISYYGKNFEISSYLDSLKKNSKIDIKYRITLFKKGLFKIIKWSFLIKNIFLALKELVFVSRTIYFFKKEFSIKIEHEHQFGIITQYAHIAKNKNLFIPSPWVNFDSLIKKKLWCFLYVKTNDFKNFNELKKILKSDDIKNYIFIQSFGSIGLIFKTIWMYLSFLLKFIFVSKKKLFLFNKVDFYNIFFDDFQKSFVGADSIKNISNFLLIKRLSENYKIKNLFYLFENQPHEKAINYFFKAKSKLIGFAHSSIRMWHLSYFNYKKIYKNGLFEPDYICLSKNFYNYTKKMNFNSKIINVEPIRFLNKENEINKNYSNNKKKFLIIGDILTNNTQNLLTLIREFKKSHKNYKFYFKPHIASNLKCLQTDIFKIVYGDIQDCAKNFDYFICGSTTTGGIVPLINNKQIIFFKDSEILNLSPLVDVSNNIFFSNVDQLSKCIRFNFKSKNIKYERTNSLKKWTNFIKKL